MIESNKWMESLMRFMSRVAYQEGTDCWMWAGGLRNDTPYGNYSYLGRTMTAHRASYIFHRGSISDDLHTDHLCRTTLCVNPDHLEAVTQAENNRRQKAVITHCPQGHEYDEKNTYYKPPRMGRMCRRCRADEMKRYKARKKEQGGR